MPSVPDKYVQVEPLGTLDFLRDWDNYSWLERHRLNRKCIKTIKSVLLSGGKVPAAGEQAAVDIHTYYKVPFDRIEILRSVVPVKLDGTSADSSTGIVDK